MGALPALAHARSQTVSRLTGDDPSQAHSVSWDRYSLKIDGNRVFIWSGSFQYWRLPSPSLWKDVLQKMKAAGFNTVTMYFYWGYHSPRDGVYDFSGVRDVDRLLDIARDVGLYVIARPGPYIEAESDAGGLPDWLTGIKGVSRSTASDYTHAYMQWLTHIDRILARHQLTNGTGTVILYQVENELYDASAMERQYMHDIEAKAREDGITVPFTGNHDGTFATGTGAVDLPGYDPYPQRFDCTHPETWNAPYDFTLERLERKETPLYFSEFQGGSFDPWGGPGYAACYRLTGPDFERVFYESAIADGTTMMNFYMAFGGTTWGWMAYPGVYTSYDYGAAINEGRQLTLKYYQQKLLGYFVQSVRPSRKTIRLAVRRPTSPSLRLDGRVNPKDGTEIYVLRHANATSTSDDRTHVWLDLAGACATTRTHDSDMPVDVTSKVAGCAVMVPQQVGTSIRINGRDSKMLLANYRFGRQTLVYSTSEWMTDLSSARRDIAVLYGREGEDGETELAYPTRPDVKVLAGQVQYRWDSAVGRLRLNYKHDGLTRVLITDSGHAFLLLIGTNEAASQIWRFDTRRGPILVNGPYLLRGASIAVGGSAHRQVLELTGDTDRPTRLEVFAPDGIDGISWNGRAVDVTRSPAGSLVGKLPGPEPVSLPRLAWKFHVGAPEIQPDFDDADWQAADRKTTNNPEWKGNPPVLNADDYGFHHGYVWYRGHFLAHATAKGVVLIAGTGDHGVFTAWLNGHYLGRSARQMGGTDDQRAYFNFDPSWLKKDKDNVLSVLVANMGHDENDDSNTAYQRPRGLIRATFVGSDDAIDWKLQGTRGGENPIDVVRGPMNNGGLYGERFGWSLPGYPDAAWHSVTLPDHVNQPGVDWYRTTFELHLPKDQDVPVALKLSDDPSRHYRALIFINGWQFGRYVNATGPQHLFVLPAGILNPDGRNTIAIAVWSTEQDGGLGDVSLQALGNYLTSLRVQPVDSPRYDAKKYARSLSHP